MSYTSKTEHSIKSTFSAQPRLKQAVKQAMDCINQVANTFDDNQFFQQSEKLQELLSKHVNYHIKCCKESVNARPDDNSSIISSLGATKAMQLLDLYCTYKDQYLHAKKYLEDVHEHVYMLLNKLKETCHSSASMQMAEDMAEQAIKTIENLYINPSECQQLKEVLGENSYISVNDVGKKFVSAHIINMMKLEVMLALELNLITEDEVSDIQFSFGLSGF